MRQQAAIVFLILHFFTATEIHQLVRMPALLKHFSEHKLSTVSLNFFEFLSMHYGNESNQHQSKGSQHEQLPFQGNCQVSLHILWVSLPGSEEIVSSPISIFKSEKSVLPSFVLPPNDGNQIWQPPKV